MKKRNVKYLLKNYCWDFSKLQFSGFKKLVTRSVFGKLQLTQISLNFKTSCSNFLLTNSLVRVCAKINMADKINMLTLVETKLDGLFWLKFFVNYFGLNSGGAMIYIKSTLSVKILSSWTLSSDMQAIPFEINLKEKITHCQYL